MNTTRLFLARHGQVVNHHELRFNGHFDVDITEKGVEQMENLAAFMKVHHINAIYSSDLLRAHRGADLIAKRLGRLINKKFAEFRELNFGLWDGLTMGEVQDSYPEEAHNKFQDLSHYRIKGGGENLVDLSNRVFPRLNDLLDLHRGKCILIVAHGGVNRVILCRTMGIPLEHFFKIEQDFGCLNIIDYFHGSDGKDFGIVKMINGGPNQEMKPPKIY
ncbi:MAG: histidine phosphatase family protein [Thermodesulfobacteriota bacterium]